MDRSDILASAASGITGMLDALRNAKVLTEDEHRQIWNVVWGVVVDAKAEQKAEQAAQELAKETAECL